MKTALVMILLAVAIACCYARPAERTSGYVPSWQPEPPDSSGNNHY